MFDSQSFSSRGPPFALLTPMWWVEWRAKLGLGLPGVARMNAARKITVLINSSVLFNDYCVAVLCRVRPNFDETYVRPN